MRVTVTEKAIIIAGPDTENKSVKFMQSRIKTKGKTSGICKLQCNIYLSLVKFLQQELKINLITLYLCMH